MYIHDIPNCLYLLRNVTWPLFLLIFLNFSLYCLTAVKKSLFNLWIGVNINIMLEIHNPNPLRYRISEIFVLNSSLKCTLLYVYAKEVSEGRGNTPSAGILCKRSLCSATAVHYCTTPSRAGVTTLSPPSPSVCRRITFYAIQVDVYKK